MAFAQFYDNQWTIFEVTLRIGNSCVNDGAAFDVHHFSGAGMSSSYHFCGGGCDAASLDNCAYESFVSG